MGIFQRASGATLPILLFQIVNILPAQTRPVRLEGAANFRDIGGLTASDGRAVRSGKLYRSGQLATLTPADYGVLSSLHIREVFDLRTDGERDAAPTRWIGSPVPELVAAPMSFSATPAGVPMEEMMRQLAARLRTEDDTRAMMTGGMAELADSGRAQIGRLLIRLTGGGPAIVHCTAGKDRTGLFVAVLLTILDVPRDRILGDYLRSNDVAEAGMTLPPGMQLPLDPKILRPMMGVEPGYLEASFRQIEKSWGSFDSYRRRGLGLTDDHVAQLKAVFLQ